MVSERTLTLDILPLSADTARLVRVYGTEPVSYTHLIFRKLQHHIAKVTGLTQADLDKGEPIVQGLRLSLIHI